MWAYNNSVGRVLDKRTEDAEVADLIGAEDGKDEEDAALHAALPTNANAETRKRKITRAKGRKS